MVETITLDDVYSDMITRMSPGIARVAMRGNDNAIFFGPTKHRTKTTLNVIKGTEPPLFSIARSDRKPLWLNSGIPHGDGYETVRNGGVKPADSDSDVLRAIHGLRMERVESGLWQLAEAKGLEIIDSEKTREFLQMMASRALNESLAISVGTNAFAQQEVQTYSV